ncbi:MAG: DUF3298 and DUF4163 domain-containing protein [Clostridia bacterium]|nr:DUF3298 and DUF4163 domain-containing protein [Clostridia bacterium]
MDVTKLPVQIVARRMVRPNLDIYYPVIIGLGNMGIQQKMNNDILKLVNQLIITQGYYQNPQTQVTGWFEIKTNERGILSLSIGNYAYPPKAAHGMTYIKSLTYEVQSGRNYQLSELFKPGSDYVKVISDNIAVQIKERDIPLLDGFKSISPNQDYYIADKALIIFFQLYEITPYYVGFPSFPISVFELQDLIKENGPLGKMDTND